MAIKPVRKEIIKPIKSGRKLLTAPIFLASKIIAPNIAGKKAINENSAPFFLFQPRERVVDIVEPDLEIPGIIAIP